MNKTDIEELAVTYYGSLPSGLRPLLIEKILEDDGSGGIDEIIDQAKRTAKELGTILDPENFNSKNRRIFNWKLTELLMLESPIVKNI